MQAKLDIIEYKKAETDGVEKIQYRLVPCTTSICIIPYRYRYRRRFAVYRLAKYRTVESILLLFQEYYNSFYFTYK